MSCCQAISKHLVQPAGIAFPSLPPSDQLICAPRPRCLTCAPNADTTDGPPVCGVVSADTLWTGRQHLHLMHSTCACLTVFPAAQCPQCRAVAESATRLRLLRLLPAAPPHHSVTTALAGLHARDALAVCPSSAICCLSEHSISACNTAVATVLTSVLPPRRML